MKKTLYAKIIWPENAYTCVCACAHAPTSNITRRSEKETSQTCPTLCSFRNLIRMRPVFSQTIGMLRRKKKNKEKIILIIALYKEHLHIQHCVPHLWASPRSLRAQGWNVNTNACVIAAVVLIYYFSILSGLMSKFFDVSYLNLRTMGEDERVKQRSCAISLFVKGNNFMPSLRLLWVSKHTHVQGTLCSATFHLAGIVSQGTGY